MTRAEARKQAHRANRRRQSKCTGHVERDRWRRAPATREQVRALRMLARQSGRTFQIAMTRGEAWRRIREATTTLDRATRLRCAPPWYSRS